MPKNRNNPPALTVVHQLDAVDAALKPLRVLWRMTGFTGAEGMSNLAKLFDPPGGLCFEETLLLKKTTAAFDIFINR